MAKKKKDEDKGMSLDDAFADDEDVEYAEAKPRKLSPKKTEKIAAPDNDENIKLKGSKPITELKKGDKIKVNSLDLEVDAHIVLIDHNSTKEMAIELFDPKTDKDYQLRYFSDRPENSVEVYELIEILYSRLPVKRIEW
ncbi:MAG: hypothetical protein KJ600_00115 [Nanoarchaeota archaeon]|nr:hypothetical protein [Nanoarchaeota archaeon]MBU1102950.1 hypothetical protein [Nanoarchaeota archaeon]